MRDRHSSSQSLTFFLGTAITDTRGQLRGALKDVAVGTGPEAGRVMGLVIGSRRARSLVAARQVRETPSGTLELRENAVLQPLSGEESLIFLSQDLLERQIIDVHGRKVVRVNDVDLQWFSAETELDLRVREVEVGMRGAMRRLLHGMLPRAGVERIARQFAPRVIPWEFVDMIEVDPARRVKLKIEHERLAQMHPSDLADILEDLAPAEREAIFTTLDEEVAADALEEVDRRLQKSLVESLDSGVAAGIMEEMDPEAAADLLAELPEARSEAILEEMDPEERQEVEELLEFREDSAAGRMTTEFVSVPEDAVVEDAVRALREFEGDPESVTEIYLLDQHRVLKAVAPLPRIVLARPESRMSVLAEHRFVSCRAEAHEQEVAALFDKYNLRALPVVNDQGRMVGVVEADHVIAFLRQGR